MLMVSGYDVLLIALAMGAAHLYTVHRFNSVLGLEAKSEWPKFSPTVSAFVPCKGLPHGLRENIEAFLTQNYEGILKLYFIVPSASDPAYPVISKILKGQDRAELIATGIKPTQSSGKIADLLSVIDQERPNGEIYLFADSDIKVGKDWVRRMVEPLQDLGIGLTTTALAYSPAAFSVWGFMRMVWNAFATSFAPVMDCVVGQSICLRRFDFENWEVAKLWSTCVMEDMALSGLMRTSDKRVYFVGRAMPVSEAACGFSDFFSVINKWVLCFRLFDPIVWCLGIVFVSLKWLVLFWSLSHGAWDVFTLFWVFEAVNIFATLEVYRRFGANRYDTIHPGLRLFPFLGALVSPVLLGALTGNFLYSIFNREIHWGDYIYRVKSRGIIEVRPRR